VKDFRPKRRLSLRYEHITRDLYKKKNIWYVIEDENVAAGSANGRPDDSGSSSPGSNPGPAANFFFIIQSGAIV
jgi:hypothetical protein